MLRSVICIVAAGCLTTAAIAEIVDPSAPTTVAPAAPLNQIAPRPIERGDIMQTMEAAGGFKTFVRLVNAAGLAETLKGKGPFTVFAPNDEAFSQIPKKQLDEMASPAHKTELEQIISYHIIPGEVTSANMSGRQAVASLEGSEVVIHATMDSVRVNTANVITGDILATNGVVHAIDNLLLPPLSADRSATN